MKYFIFTLTFLFILLALGVHSQMPGDRRFKKDFLEYINLVRKKGCICGVTYMPSVPPLVWNDQLEDAALSHARDMANKKYFSHDSKDGRNVQDRVEGAGYNHNGYRSYVIGENIAQGQQSISEVMDGWFKSEGHCKNLMNAGFKEVGVAVYNTYWVQDFGGREAFSPEMQKLIKSGKYRIIQQSRPAQ